MIKKITHTRVLSSQNVIKENAKMTLKNQFILFFDFKDTTIICQYEEVE